MGSICMIYVNEKDLVVPGELLAEDDYYSGRGTFEDLLRGAGNVTIDMVYYPDINSWQGRDSLQYVVKDLRIR